MTDVDKLTAEFNAIRFVPFPTRRRANIKAVVRVEGNILADLGHGNVAIYPMKHGLKYYWRTSEWTPPILDGLMRLGLISKAAKEQHLAQVETNRLASSRRYAAAELRDAAKRLEVPISKRQAAAIDKALAK